MAASFGFESPTSALVIGGRGGVGSALVRLLQQSGHHVIATSRNAEWADQAPEGRRTLSLNDETEVRRFAEGLQAEHFEPRLIINATGLLHDEDLTPERSLKELSQASMHKVFEVNTFAVATLLATFVPKMPRRGRSVFASLSARVGSIEDCRLGGWYSYRASKAAQNMLLRCAAIEAARSHRELACVALHPGTVSTELSAPFTRKKKEGLFSPDESAAHLEKVIAGVDASESGGFFAWDGSKIPF